MAVLRINKTKDYTVMSNYHFREKEMSLKAKGLLSLMLSLPDSWDYSIAGLVAICKESETSVNSTLKELKQFGYLVVRKLLPNQTKSGRIEYVYYIYEKPIDVLKKEGNIYQGQEEQEQEKQDLENQGVEFLGVDNIGQLNTNTLNIKESNTKKSNTYNGIYSPATAEQCKIPYDEICDYLNLRTNSNYKSSTKKTRDLIKARFNEGFKIEDFKIVIDKKTIDWINNKDFKQYLRPETLFGTKFESYLNQPVKQVTTKDINLDVSDFFKE